MSEKLREQIEEYTPFDAIESVEKESFLQFIHVFSDKIWGRDNLVGHITVSAWIVNKDRTEVIMAHHNLYNSWAWLGGHADGDNNLLRVCLKEVEEECGVKDIKVLCEDVFDIEVVRVARHLKKGVEVPDHLHFNVTFLLEVDRNSKLSIKEDENSGVKWVKNEDVLSVSNEEKMKYIYKRLMKKTCLLNK